MRIGGLENRFKFLELRVFRRQFVSRRDGTVVCSRFFLCSIENVFGKHESISATRFLQVLKLRGELLALLVKLFGLISKTRREPNHSKEAPSTRNNAPKCRKTFVV